MNMSVETYTLDKLIEAGVPYDGSKGCATGECVCVCVYVCCLLACLAVWLWSDLSNMHVDQYSHTVSHNNMQVTKHAILLFRKKRMVTLIAM